jgi:hypothetical protein
MRHFVPDEEEVRAMSRPRLMVELGFQVGAASVSVSSTIADPQAEQRAETDLLARCLVQ